jgi:hypothetical protein
MLYCHANEKIHFFFTYPKLIEVGNTKLNLVPKKYKNFYPSTSYKMPPIYIILPRFSKVFTKLSVYKILGVEKNICYLVFI